MFFKRLFKLTDSDNSQAQNDNSSNGRPSIVCIYAAYNIDDDDYRFIKDNKDDCSFIVIDSMDRPSLNNNRLRRMSGIEYMTRPNVGYDVSAWKDYILDNYKTLKEFDYVALVNNSCRYDFKIRDALDDMISKQSTFYGLNISPVHNDHVQSYFTIVAKEVVATDGFYNHWRNMRPITGRDDAIKGHELTFMNDMKRAGAHVATLTTYDFIGSGYEPERYNKDMGTIPPFIKKKLMMQGATRSIYERLLKTLPHML